MNRTFEFEKKRKVIILICHQLIIIISFEDQYQYSFISLAKK